jgi:endoglucanase
MRLQQSVNPLFAFTLLAGIITSPFASKLAELRVLDQNILMVRLMDGEVTHRDDGIGPNAFTNNYHEDNIDTVKNYTPLLSTTAAQEASNWTLTSADDATFGAAGAHPAQCYRKTKLNGHAERAWQQEPINDFLYESTYEHTLYLKFTQTFKQGSVYTLAISAAINSDPASATIAYDIFNSRSEAIHVNLAGYHPDVSAKSADLYCWMGDGGSRDYSPFVGKTVYLYDTASKQSTDVGKVVFWKASGSDVGGYNLTRSAVWNADFPNFTTPGVYRLAIEGVGCSQDFIISNNAYYLPFMVSTQGFFYMRIGQDSGKGIKPVPRRPLYIPGVNPTSTKVYLTTMTPYHTEWGSFSGGDVWDNPNDWARFRKTGNPTNSNAFGGHSDALDWDRHLGHIANIYDMLLPFYLTNGAISDDNCDIAESGNGIPDILDEARNEVDFWLRLRDGAAYSHGLTNPNDNNEFFQAGPTVVAAWANAANAAMLADCFGIAGLPSLANQYKDSAVIAYAYASSQTDQMLDKKQGIGDAVIRGRDLKMMAAAALYNCTGQTAYEDAVNLESMVKSANSILEDYGNGDSKNQVWATAIYLMTKQTVHYPELYSNMKASAIAQAKTKEANLSTSRPSRRSTLNSAGYFRTAQNVHHTLIAHAICDQPADKTLFRKALVLEADYGLGRNPLNMIQMTTASTPLENKRSVMNAYTTGHDDGTPGMHPGHTPYFNLDDWDENMTMGSPSKLYANAYPTNFTATWPMDEAYFNTKYVWAHNEFTPQQTMRGKMALYGYLYGITKNNGASVTHFGQRSVPLLTAMSGFRRGDKIQIITLAGRVVWAGTFDGNRCLLNNKAQSRGIYFIKRLRDNSAIMRMVMDQD